MLLSGLEYLDHWMLLTAVVDALQKATWALTVGANTLLAALFVTVGAHWIPRNIVCSLELKHQTLVCAEIYQV